MQKVTSSLNSPPRYVPTSASTTPIARPATSVPAIESRPPTITATNTDNPNTPMVGEIPPIDPMRMPAPAAAMPATIHEIENTAGTLIPHENAAP